MFFSKKLFPWGSSQWPWCVQRNQCVYQEPFPASKWTVFQSSLPSSSPRTSGCRDTSTSPRKRRATRTPRWRSTMRPVPPVPVPLRHRPMASVQLAQRWVEPPEPPQVEEPWGSRHCVASTWQIGCSVNLSTLDEKLISGWGFPKLLREIFGEK